MKNESIFPTDARWKQWFAELLQLAAHHGITTSDDADLWSDDFGAGKTPKESMEAFLDSDEGAPFRDKPEEGERPR